MVPRHQLKISVSTVFDSEDLSGETSGTERTHKGIKPKEISATFVLPYKDKEKLTEFYQHAQAVDDNGDLVIYDINEASTNAANIHQVKFSGRIEQREMQSHNAWRIAFKLREHLSVPEKTEQRQETTEVQTATEGQQVALAPADEVTEEESLTGFESILKKIDDALA